MIKSYPSLGQHRGAAQRAIEVATVVIDIPLIFLCPTLTNTILSHQAEGEQFCSPNQWEIESYVLPVRGREGGGGGGLLVNIIYWK